MKNKLLILLIFGFKISIAQNYFSVFIKDSISKEPISYASVVINHHKYLTNDFGEITIKQDTTTTYLVQVSCIGFKSYQRTINKTNLKTTLYLMPSQIGLNEVTVKTFTDATLANYFLNAHYKSKALLQSSAAQIVTYSTENNAKPIEYASSLVNITITGRQLNPIEVKYGEILFDFYDLANAFKSEAITFLFYQTSPYSKLNNRYFITPFVAKNIQDLLAYYTLNFEWVTANLLKIKFKAKLNKTQGSIIITYDKMELVETNLEWIFSTNYPLITIGGGRFEGDIKIITKLIFDEGRFQHQTLKTNLQYNIDGHTDSVETNAYLSLSNKPIFNLPLNAINFSSDYNTLLSRPTNQLMRTNLPTHKSLLMDSIINNNANLLNGIDYLSPNKKEPIFIESRLLMQQLTSVDFWDTNWKLDWRKVNETTIKETDYIDIRIFADYFSTKDTIEYNIQPLFNYNATFYSGERNVQTHEYFSLLFHIAKIKSDELTAYLIKNYPKDIDYKTFKKIVNKYDNEFKKESFKYKKQANGGANQTAMVKWRDYVINHIEIKIEE